MGHQNKFLSITSVVDRGQRRLARAAGRALLLRHGLAVVVLAALIGAARPLYYPVSSEAPLWLGLAVAVGVSLLLTLLGFLLLLGLGRQNRPSAFATARAIDDSLDLTGVVAAGVAFEKAPCQQPLMELAQKRAREALKKLHLRRALPLPSLLPRKRSVFVATALLGLAAIFGSHHPRLTAILISPPSEEELAAAATLDHVADELARHHTNDDRRTTDQPQPEDTNSPDSDSRSRRADELDALARRAEKAAAAARQGDRASALNQLNKLGHQRSSASDEASLLGELLRSISHALAARHALAGPGKSAGSGEREGSKAARHSQTKSDGDSDGSASKSGSSAASQMLKQLAAELREQSPNAELGSKTQRAMLEAIARAVSQSEGTSARSKNEAHRELTRALTQSLTKAGEALSQEQREQASQHLEEAMRQAEALQTARERAMAQDQAIARLLEAAGMLGRSIQQSLATKNKGSGSSGAGQKIGQAQFGQGAGAGRSSGKNGSGQGQPSPAFSQADLARALALRLAALGVSGGAPSGQPGTGPEGSVDNRRTPSKALPVNGSQRARSVVSEGQRAVTAIQGLGRAAAPTKEYRDVYPSYSALVEESIADEVVPVAQRGVVRRYFESIRPGGSATDAE